MRLNELCSLNPLRIPHPKIDKLACQAQGAGILAKGEITLHDAYCTYLILCTSVHHNYGAPFDVARRRRDISY